MSALYLGTTGRRAGIDYPKLARLRRVADAAQARRRGLIDRRGELMQRLVALRAEIPKAIHPAFHFHLREALPDLNWSDPLPALIAGLPALLAAPPKALEEFEAPRDLIDEGRETLDAIAAIAVEIAAASVEADAHLRLVSRLDAYAYGASNA